jgi:hypothetical protein
MPRFDVTVTPREHAPVDAPAAAKCKCKCDSQLDPSTVQASFEVTVTERDLGPARARGAQKCKCKCPCGSVAPDPGPWSEARTRAGSLPLSPLGD